MVTPVGLPLVAARVGEVTKLTKAEAFSGLTGAKDQKAAANATQLLLAWIALQPEADRPALLKELVTTYKKLPADSQKTVLATLEAQASNPIAKTLVAELKPAVAKPVDGVEAAPTQGKDQAAPQLAIDPKAPLGERAALVVKGNADYELPGLYKELADLQPADRKEFLAKLEEQGVSLAELGTYLGRFYTPDEVHKALLPLVPKGEQKAFKADVEARIGADKKALAGELPPLPLEANLSSHQATYAKANDALLADPTNPVAQENWARAHDQLVKDIGAYTSFLHTLEPGSPEYKATLARIEKLWAKKMGLDAEMTKKAADAYRKNPSDEKTKAGFALTQQITNADLQVYEQGFLATFAEGGKTRAALLEHGMEYLGGFQRASAGAMLDVLLPDDSQASKLIADAHDKKSKLHERLRLATKYSGVEITPEDVEYYVLTGRLTPGMAVVVDNLSQSGDYPWLGIMMQANKARAEFLREEGKSDPTKAEANKKEIEKLENENAALPEKGRKAMYQYAGGFAAAAQKLEAQHPDKATRAKDVQDKIDRYKKLALDNYDQVAGNYEEIGKDRKLPPGHPTLKLAYNARMGKGVVLSGIGFEKLEANKDKFAKEGVAPDPIVPVELKQAEVEFKKAEANDPDSKTDSKHHQQMRAFYGQQNAAMEGMEGELLAKGLPPIQDVSDLRADGEMQLITRNRARMDKLDKIPVDKRTAAEAEEYKGLAEEQGRLSVDRQVGNGDVEALDTEKKAVGIDLDRAKGERAELQKKLDTQKLLAKTPMFEKEAGARIKELDGLIADKDKEIGAYETRNKEIDTKRPAALARKEAIGKAGKDDLLPDGQLGKLNDTEIALQQEKNKTRQLADDEKQLKEDTAHNEKMRAMGPPMDAMAKKNDVFLANRKKALEQKQADNAVETQKLTQKKNDLKAQIDAPIGEARAYFTRAKSFTQSIDTTKLDAAGKEEVALLGKESDFALGRFEASVGQYKLGLKKQLMNRAKIDAKAEQDQRVVNEPGRKKLAVLEARANNRANDVRPSNQYHVWTEFLVDPMVGAKDQLKTYGKVYLDAKGNLTTPDKAWYAYEPEEWEYYRIAKGGTDAGMHKTVGHMRAKEANFGLAFEYDQEANVAFDAAKKKLAEPSEPLPPIDEIVKDPKDVALRNRVLARRADHHQQQVTSHAAVAQLGFGIGGAKGGEGEKLLQDGAAIARDKLKLPDAMPTGDPKDPKVRAELDLYGKLLTSHNLAWGSIGQTAHFGRAVLGAGPSNGDLGVSTHKLTYLTDEALTAFDAGIKKKEDAAAAVEAGGGEPIASLELSAGEQLYGQIFDVVVRPDLKQWKAEQIDFKSVAAQITARADTDLDSFEDDYNQVKKELDAHTDADIPGVTNFLAGVVGVFVTGEVHNFKKETKEGDENAIKGAKNDANRAHTQYVDGAVVLGEISDPAGKGNQEDNYRLSGIMRDPRLDRNPTSTEYKAWKQEAQDFAIRKKFPKVAKPGDADYEKQQAWGKKAADDLAYVGTHDPQMRGYRYGAESPDTRKLEKSYAKKGEGHISMYQEPLAGLYETHGLLSQYKSDILETPLMQGSVLFVEVGSSLVGGVGALKLLQGVKWVKGAGTAINTFRMGMSGRAGAAGARVFGALGFGEKGVRFGRALFSAVPSFAFGAGEAVLGVYAPAGMNALADTLKIPKDSLFRGVLELGANSFNVSMMGDAANLFKNGSLVGKGFRAGAEYASLMNAGLAFSLATIPWSLQKLGVDAKTAGHIGIGLSIFMPALLGGVSTYQMSKGAQSHADGVSRFVPEGQQQAVNKAAYDEHFSALFLNTIGGKDMGEVLKKRRADFEAKLLKDPAMQDPKDVAHAVDVDTLMLAEQAHTPPKWDGKNEDSVRVWKDMQTYYGKVKDTLVAAGVDPARADVLVKSRMQTVYADALYKTDKALADKGQAGRDEREAFRKLTGLPSLDAPVAPKTERTVVTTGIKGVGSDGKSLEIGKGTIISDAKITRGGEVEATIVGAAGDGVTTKKGQTIKMPMHEYIAATDSVPVGTKLVTKDGVNGEVVHARDGQIEIQLENGTTLTMSAKKFVAENYTSKDTGVPLFHDDARAAADKALTKGDVVKTEKVEGTKAKDAGPPQDPTNPGHANAKPKGNDPPKAPVVPEVPGYTPPKEAPKQALAAEYAHENVDPQRPVVYLDADGRKPFAADLKDGKLVGAEGEKFDSRRMTKDKPAEWEPKRSDFPEGDEGNKKFEKAVKEWKKDESSVMFTLADDGTLYVEQRGHKNENIQQSSFVAGGPVRAAGDLVVRDGKIVGIGDRSEHYPQKLENTEQAVLHLHKNGVDLKELKVTTLEWGTLTGTEFLTRMQQRREGKLVDAPLKGNARVEGKAVKPADAVAQDAAQAANDMANTAPIPNGADRQANAKAFTARKAHNEGKNEKIFAGKEDHPAKDAGVTADRLKLAVIGDPPGERVPLVFKDKAQYEQFQKELDEVFRSEGITDAVVQQVGSATTGWRGNPDKDPGAWKPGSDSDFAIFSEQALVAAKDANVPVNEKIKMDGQYTVFKNDEGGTGFYYQTALGKKLNEFSRKWNQKLYGKPSVDGVEFKLNLGTAPFNGAVTVIKPTGRTHVDTKIKPENPVVLGKDGQPGPAHLKVEVARNQKDAAGQPLPDKEYASVTVAAPKNIDELPGGTLLRDGTEKGKALLPLDDNGIAKPPREPEYHVTLFTPDEMAYIKEHYPEKYEELKKTGFQVDGEPKGVKVERRTSDRGRMFIMTVDWPEAIKLRESLGLKRHDLHVSLSANDARYATKKDPNAPTPKKSWEEKK